MECNRYRNGQGSHIYGTLLEEFPKGHEDTVDDEHNISSSNIWSVKDDHTYFKGHVIHATVG